MEGQTGTEEEEEVRERGARLRHVTKSSRECYNRPPLGAERQRLDVNQNLSTTHRLAIVAYSLDSISGHFIIQLGQLSHHTPQKRGLQSN